MPLDFVEEKGIDFQEEAAPIDFAEEESSPVVASLIQKPAASPEELSAQNFYKQLQSTGRIPEMQHDSFWENLNRPIEPLANWVTGMSAQDLALKLVPESAKQTTAGKIAVGTQKGVNEAVKGFVSPLGIATLGLGSLPKAAQSLISAAFATHMATTLPEQTKLAVQAIKEGDTEKAAQYITGTALTGAFVGLAGKHAITSGKEVLTDFKMEAAKEVGPATAAVISKESGKEPSPAVSAPEPVVPPATAAGEIKTPISVESPTAIGPSMADITPPIEKAQLPVEQPLIGLGAATPAEFELKPQNATSIKNATVDVEREKRGLPPAMKPARQDFGTVWDDAMAKIDADNGYTNRLLDELRKDPRPARPIENAVLTHRQIELQNEYNKAMRDLTQAVDDGRLEDKVSEQLRVDALREQLWDVYEIGKKVGTEQARGLNIRKLMAYEDFSLAKMELEKRAAKDGEQLTDAERAEVVAQNKKIEETQKALDEHTAGTDERVLQRETDRTLKEAKESKEPVEPLEDITGKLKEKFMAGEKEAITPLVQKLARYFVAQGITERGALIEAVHGVIKDIDPTLTIRDTMDAISGYGNFKRLTKDEISVKLRDLKGQMQQVAKLEDMQASKPPLKTGTERRIPSDEERRLIKLVNEAKNKFQIPITDEATQLKSSLDTLKTRLRNQIVDFEARLKAKDFEKKPKRFIQMDDAAQKLHFEAAKAKAEWHKALMKDRLARRSLPAKIIGGVGETLNTIRAIMTSGEFSGVLRQGGFIGIGNPSRIVKAFPAMIRALRSEQGMHAVNMEIMSRPNYPLYVRSKLFLSEHGQKLSQMEEAYMSRWAEKIPVVAGTQRAYSTFLNKLRADSFDAMAKTLVRRQGELTPERANAIANFINVATGRGNVVGKEATLVGLNTYFFAPRWVLSRFQLALGQPLIRGDKHTRRLIAEEYAKYLIGMGVIYGLWRMSGEEVETDPRSSDFGKLRVGETRVDLMAGLQQGTVLMSRLASGETKRLSGQVVPIRGEDIPYGSDDSAQVIGRFLRTKMAPVPGSAVDLLSGKNVAGEPVTPQSELMELTVPLTYRDIYKAMIEQGVPVGTALSLLAIFGAGVQTYD